MKKALEFIVSSIVDDPKACVIDENENEGVIEFTIHVAKDDMGKVIGKNGKIIRAIRNIMKIPAIKQNKRIHVSLAQEENE